MVFFRITAIILTRLSVQYVIDGINQSAFFREASRLVVRCDNSRLVHTQPLMIQGELVHKWNRDAWVTECLILSQAKAPQNNKILS